MHIHVSFVSLPDVMKTPAQARGMKNLRIEEILNWTLAEARTLHRRQRQKKRLERIKVIRNKRIELISADTQLAKYYPISAKKKKKERGEIKTLTSCLGNVVTMNIALLSIKLFVI
jgi:hypothetical protein